MDNKQKLHAIMIPLLTQGHVRPHAHLAMKLASKGFTITFVNTESIHHQLCKAHKTSDIFDEARKSGLDIRYVTISDGLPLGFDRTLNLDTTWKAQIHVFSAHVDELIKDIVHLDPPINCLVVDTFNVWSSMITKKYNLVNVSFWTEPALVFSVYYHLDLLRCNGHYEIIDNRKDTIDYIPGVHAIEPEDLMSFLQETDTSTVSHEFIEKAYRDVKHADMILCNTVEELEFDVIAALKEKQPFYAVGPVLPVNPSSISSFKTGLWPESDCIQWLDTKPEGSVLYISFGSMFTPSKQEILEIAHGLLLSKVSFIWVLRDAAKSSIDASSLPVGFQSEIEDRGLFIPWCSQPAVISHPAVGGFLTHCGWNSVLESMVCGVPMMCFPLISDQITNRKLVVDDWKVGINLCDKKPVSREGVAENVNRLMIGSSAVEIKKRSKEMKDLLEDVLHVNGSSEKNLDSFVHGVLDCIQRKNIDLYSAI